MGSLGNDDDQQSYRPFFLKVASDRILLMKHCEISNLSICVRELFHP